MIVKYIIGLDDDFRPVATTRVASVTGDVSDIVASMEKRYHKVIEVNDLVKGLEAYRQIKKEAAGIRDILEDLRNSTNDDDEYAYYTGGLNALARILALAGFCASKIAESEKQTCLYAQDNKQVEAALDALDEWIISRTTGNKELENHKALNMTKLVRAALNARPPVNQELLEALKIAKQSMLDSGYGEDSTVIISCKQAIARAMQKGGV